jgi:hypothetical protein
MQQTSCFHLTQERLQVCIGTCDMDLQTTCTQPLPCAFDVGCGLGIRSNAHQCTWGKSIEFECKSCVCACNVSVSCFQSLCGLLCVLILGKFWKSLITTRQGSTSCPAFCLYFEKTSLILCSWANRVENLLNNAIYNMCVQKHVWYARIMRLKFSVHI